MARELCGIKVKIGLKANGHADYPDFSQLQCVKDSGLDWSTYIDSAAFGDGAGWHYDKTCGHCDDSVESPIGSQLAMLVMNEDFCRQALAMFPGQCSAMNENECCDFHENKSTAHIPTVKYDSDVLNGRNAELSLLDKLINAEADATKKASLINRRAECLEEAKESLNPDSPLPGVRRLKGKTWADHKNAYGIDVITLKDIG